MAAGAAPAIPALEAGPIPALADLLLKCGCRTTCHSGHEGMRRSSLAMNSPSMTNRWGARSVGCTGSLRCWEGHLRQAQLTDAKTQAHESLLRLAGKLAHYALQISDNRSSQILFGSPSVRRDAWFVASVSNLGLRWHIAQPAIAIAIVKSIGEWR